MEETTFDTTNTTDKLCLLSDLKGYKVASGYPDIRGWEIYGLGDAHLGEVKDLIVDTGACRARYLVAAVGKSGFLGLGKRREVIVPIGRARLEDNRDRVFLDNLNLEQLEAFPEWDRNSFNRERESSFFPSLGTGADRYNNPDYDESRFFGRRRGSGDQYLVLYAEQVQVGKQPVQVGEAVVQKRVETERVTEQVPLMREDVTVERRPIAPGTPVSQEGAFTEDEVRIPLMAEQATVEKQVVPVEEVVIKKTTQQITQPVETEVRKETADVQTPDVLKKEPV
jgi:uncharacterized protein (TIGR02271 family)